MTGLLGDHPSGPAVACRLVRPTRDLIGGQPPSLLGLAPGGVCQAATVARGAGGLLHHRFTLAGDHSPAVFSLLHFPSGHPAWELPSTLPCGVRTFLDTGLWGTEAAVARRTRRQFYRCTCLPAHRSSGDSFLPAAPWPSGKGQNLVLIAPPNPPKTIATTAKTRTWPVAAGLPPRRATIVTRPARARPDRAP